MSTNNSRRLLKSKIEYKTELIETEKTTTKESIKPVEHEAVTPKKASLIRTMFEKAVNEIKASWEKFYIEELTLGKKAINNFVKGDTRKNKKQEEVVTL